MDVLTVAIITALVIAGYMCCFLYSRKLVEDYWQWRFGHLPTTFSRLDWVYWFGPISVGATIGFRLMNLNKEPL